MCNIFCCIYCTFVVILQQILFFMDTLEKIGLAIKTRRKELGLSQERLAFEANLDRTYIPKVEAGQINITIKSLEKIASALRVPINYFFLSL